MSKWTREKIILEILRREATGLPLTNQKKFGQGVESALYSAAMRTFGSWRSAVMAAGIAPEKALVHERWSLSRVLAIIRALGQRRHRLSATEIEQRYGKVSEAARRYFGSWPKAMLAAGVDPAKVLRVMPWTRERIIEAILTRVLGNEPLRRRSVAPSSLAEAGIRIFGSWESALVAAGLDPNLYIDGGLRERPERPSREPIGNHSLVAAEQMQNCSTRCQADPGDPLVIALPSSGMASEVSRRRRKNHAHWLEQQVLDAVLTRLREQRKMNATAVYKDDRPLYRAARRYHGNWHKALLAAGLNPGELRKNGGRGFDHSQVGASLEVCPHQNDGESKASDAIQRPEPTEQAKT